MIRPTPMSPVGAPPIVVDASVGMKWAIKEENTPHALALLGSGRRLIVPDRFYSEVANVLWKRTRRAEPSERITEGEAREGLRDVLSVDLEVVASKYLVDDSLEIALETGHPTYDCDYLALAVKEGAEFMTADAKSFRKLAGDPKYGPLVSWVDPTGTPPL